MVEINKAQKTFLAMNTVVSHTAYGSRAERALLAAQRETRRLEGLFSRFLPDSDIARLNRAAGDESTRIASETFAVLSLGLACAKYTDGCFDMTVGPLVRLWNTPCVQQTQQEINAAKALTGFKTLQLQARGRNARLTYAGQSVDLGGIGKGYAADCITTIFKRYGICSAFTDFGGNVAALGRKPDGSPWNIGIRHPQRDKSLIGVLSVSDQSVVTSGDDQRAVPGADGICHSHIIDPRTGMPAKSGLLSATVVSQSSALADALATALFIAGLEDGMRYLKGYPGTQAVLIDRDASVYITDGLTHCFRPTKGSKTTVLSEGIA